MAEDQNTDELKTEKGGEEESLQKLRDEGILTEEEFAAQKNKILGGM